MPEGPMMSNAEIMLETKCMTLVKLSSPMLQEPSIRKTTSALAPLHTGVKQRKERKSMPEEQNRHNSTRGFHQCQVEEVSKR